MKKISVYVPEYQLVYMPSAICAWSCVGVCKDFLRENCSGYRNKDILKMELQCPDNFDPTNFDGFVRINGCVDPATGNIIALWVGSEMPPMDQPFNTIEGTLYTDTYEPVSDAFVRTQFWKGENGRLLTRLNLHPEIDGKTCLGKVYFPDRSFVDACEGEAVIEVASVKEFETYGFVKGKMFTYDEFNMSAFLDWAWENYALLKAEYPCVAFTQNAMGEYAILRSRFGATIVVYFDGGLHWKRQHDESCTYNQFSNLGELFLKDRFGDDAEKVMEMFTPAKSANLKFHEAFWYPESKIPGGCPDMLISGLSQGFLRCVLLDGNYPGDSIYAYEIADKAESTAFSDEELEQMASQYNAANAAADEKVKALIKRKALAFRP